MVRSLEVAEHENGLRGLVPDYEYGDGNRWKFYGAKYLTR